MTVVIVDGNFSADDEWIKCCAGCSFGNKHLTIGKECSACGLTASEFYWLAS